MDMDNMRVILLIVWTFCVTRITAETAVNGGHVTVEMRVLQFDNPTGTSYIGRAHTGQANTRRDSGTGRDNTVQGNTRRDIGTTQAYTGQGNKRNAHATENAFTGREFGQGHDVTRQDSGQGHNFTGQAYKGVDFYTDRRCCDGNTIPNCTDSGNTCDTYFNFCVSSFEQNGSSCDTWQTTKQTTLTDQNSYIYVPGNGTELTITTTIDNWQTGDVGLYVYVYDSDAGNGSDIIDTFSHPLVMFPDTSYMDAHRHVVHLRHMISLDLEVRVWCQDGYSGPNCSRPCTADVTVTCDNLGVPRTRSSCGHREALFLPLLSSLQESRLSIQRRLQRYMAFHSCPRNTSQVDVNITDVTSTGIIFTGACGNVTVTGLKFAQSLFEQYNNGTVDTLSGTSGLPLAPPAIQRLQPAQQNDRIQMLFRILQYKDTNRSCSYGQDCATTIKLCFGSTQDNACEGRLVTLDGDTNNTLVSCDNMLVWGMEESSHTNLSTVYFTTQVWPRHVQWSVLYGNRGVWISRTRPLLFRARQTYDDTDPFFVRQQYGFKSLSLELLIWCGRGYSGVACQHYCPQLSPTQDCNPAGEVVCKPGYNGPGCADIDECRGQHVCNNGVACINTPGSFTCTCPDGLYGPTCSGRYDADECSLNPCSNNGTCSNTDTGYQCACALEFSGQSCDNDVNECETGGCVLCGNGGTCFNVYGSFYCVCETGYSGQNCTDDVNECTDRGICGHGTCNNYNGGYNCSCAEGYEGSNCQQDIDKCTNANGNVCANGGTCVNIEGSFKCKCARGWDGSDCNTDINECRNGSICAHGICNNTKGGYSCWCYFGWSGDNCDQDVDECAFTEVCHNGGTCVNTNGSFQCVCPGGWTGRHCLTDINECLVKQALCKHGHCVNIAGSYSCSCYFGWEGEHCDQDVDECAFTEVCHNGGTCVNTNGSFQCVCPGGWTGRHCLTDINECLVKQALCKHGHCVNIAGSYSCSCYFGWEGEHCDLNVDECISAHRNLCANGGTCLDLQGNFQCVCPANWTGTHCRTYVDKCETWPCLNNGTCHDSSDIGPVCVCASNWRGSNCGENVDECGSGPCHNGGTCLMGLLANHRCLCLPWWTGTLCEKVVDECSLHMCKNNGKCHNYNGTFNCTCTNNWTGYQCEHDVDECESSPCLHGSCENTLGSYVCHCTHGWSGQSCEIDMDACRYSPCRNNGSCSTALHGYSCQCSTGWAGVNCTQDIDECFAITKLCQNNVSCINNNGSFACVCIEGFEGEHCEIQIEVTTNSVTKSEATADVSEAINVSTQHVHISTHSSPETIQSTLLVTSMPSAISKSSSNESQVSTARPSHVTVFSTNSGITNTTTPKSSTHSPTSTAIQHSETTTMTTTTHIDGRHAQSSTHPTTVRTTGWCTLPLDVSECVDDEDTLHRGIRELLLLNECKDSLDINVTIVKHTPHKVTNVTFAASCDGRELTNRDIHQVIGNMSTEQLRSLLQCQRKTTDPPLSKPWIRRHVTLVESLFGVATVLLILGIGVAVLLRRCRHAVPDHKRCHDVDLELDHSNTESGVDNPVYFHFTNNDTNTVTST